MAYRELVKRFESVREYMRDFLVFGYKTRREFDSKSARTYDNERRRIESWLGDDLRWEYGARGKAIFLSMDAAELVHNPLYRAWQSKSFTDNDITLHFCLLDLLADGVPLHAEEITDALAARYGVLFELPTVRRKLKEYGALGILEAKKQGRALCYTLSPCTLDSLFPAPARLPELLCFFGETAPLSVVGSFLASRRGEEDQKLRFKHHFIVHTLEDQMLLTALEAIRTQARLEVTNVSGRSGTELVMTVVPVKIMVSVQTGRRYLAAWLPERRRFTSLRLDYIKALSLRPGLEEDSACRTLAEERLAHSWGAVLHSSARLERFSITVAADEDREAYIIQRLRRESRGGTVEQVEPGLWRCTRYVYDASEMMNWVKTFIGRIVSLEGDNQAAIERFCEDVRRMAEMYGGEG